MRLQSLVVSLVLCGVGVGAAWGGTVTANPTSHDFGNVGVSAGPTAAFVVTLTNATDDTDITGFTLTGSCGEFAVDGGALPATLNNNDTLDVSVTYNPNDRTADSCVVQPTFGNGSASGTGGSFTITGDGIAPVLQVTESMLVYADQRWNGGTPEIKNITITNIGEQTIATANLTVTLTTGTQFSLGAAVGTPIANGESATIPVTFNPASLGSKSDTVTIALNNDAPADPNGSVTLMGSGIQSVQGFSPSPLPITGVEVGSNDTGNLTIGNTGAATLNLTSVRIFGGNFTEFSFTDHNCSGQAACAPTGGPIAATNGTAVFAIRCTPTQPGLRTSTLEVTSDDPGGPRTVTLNCTGTSPEVTVTPTSIPFGVVRVGQASPQNFTISNSNAANTSNLTYSVAEALTDISITCNPTCSGTLNPGANATVTVTFAPNSTGLRMGNVVVTTNDLDEGTVNVAVSGTGAESNLSSATGGGFGNVPVVQTNGATQNVVITNNGGISLNTTNMTLSGDAAFSFAFGSGLCTSGTTCTRVVTAAASGGTANIPVRCDPSSGGLKMATLNIQSDDPAPAGGTDVALTCTGTQSAMVVTPPSIPFANQRINTSSTAQAITVNNTAGAAALNYAVTAPAGGQYLVSVGAVNCTPTCNNLTVAAGANATVNVVFRPTSIGLKNGVVVVDDLDNFASDANVAVSGTGVEPVAFLSTAATLPFGNVVNGTTSAAQTITVMNTGTMDLTINSVVEVDAGDNFDLTGPTGVTTVTMGGMQSWGVSCDPETRGAKTATITINNNSTNAPAIVVTLTCTSIEGLLVGTAAAVPLTGGIIDFGPVRLNTSVTTTVTLTNQGNVDVTVSNLGLSPTTEGFSNTALVADNVVPANGGTRTFTVTFLPTLDTQGMATLTITSDWNDPIIMLRGDGEPTGFACLPQPAMMGDVDWDGTKPQVITLRNTGTASVNVLTVSFSMGGAEFAALPTNTGLGVLTQGQMRTFTITAVPTDAMLGLRSATLHVTTDLPPGMGQVCDVPITFTSIGPAVTLDPGMLVDFGGVDVDAGPVTRQLQVTNSGSGRMDILTTGPLAAPFERTDFTPGGIPSSQSQTLTIEYDPSVERDAANPDTQNFTIETDGLYMGGSGPQPALIQVTVRGYGIDRHFAAAPVKFPPTYRNPTDAQIPTTTCGDAMNEPCSIKVCNSGEALLDITMIDDPDDAFDLASTAPIMVTGGSAAQPNCREVAVQFRPTSYNQFTGTVTIMNNDDATPMAMVTLTGEGIPRPVEVMPNTALAATIAIGAPVRLSDILASGLVLHNMSGTETFDAEVSPGSLDTGVTATLVGDDGILAVNETRNLDVEIIGTAVGAPKVTVEVHLDGDPDPHSTFEIQLDVVRVDVEGGGCDSGGGGATGGAALALLAIAGGLMVRRRRVVGAAAALLFVMFGLSGTRTAAADVSRNIDVGTAPASTATEPGLFDVDTPDVADKGSWAIGFAVQHESNPMVARWKDSAMADHELGLITTRDAFAIGFGYAVTDKLELSARLPMYQQKGEDRAMGTPFGVEGADGFALGDVGVRAKAQVIEGKVGFAGALDLTAPTAKDGQFAGTDLPTAHIQGLLGIRAGRRISLALNAGFLARQSTQFLLVEQGSELTYGAALAVRVLDKVAVVGEGTGALGVVGAEGSVSPTEVSIGLRVRATRGATIGFGGGSGFGHGIGVPDMRGFFTLTLAPGGSRIDPVRIIVPPPPRDTRDDDGDGVVNADDACPTDAEDQDGFKDDDGCPEADNDDDGVLDADDKCATEPEDKDGFQDDDGCIDKDNDGDGIDDVDDKCPAEPEDKDGFNDNDGCDEPDNDNDGVPDVLDQCALEPETINGNDDEDGCPDKGDAGVMLMQDRIEVLEPISFIGLTAKLKPAGAKVLSQVGATMRAERGVKRVRVTVHVHPRGPGDDALSEKRADEIRKWLVQWGVEPERIEAKGIGSKRPLVAKSKKGAEEINDRVEFIILERN